MCKFLFLFLNGRQAFRDLNTWFLFSFMEAQQLEDFKAYKFQHPNFRDKVEESGPEVVSWLRWHNDQKPHACLLTQSLFLSVLLWVPRSKPMNAMFPADSYIYTWKHLLLIFNFLSVSTRRYKSRTFNFSIQNIFFNSTRPCVIVMKQIISIGYQLLQKLFVWKEWLSVDNLENWSIQGMQVGLPTQKENKLLLLVQKSLSKISLSLKSLKSLSKKAFRSGDKMLLVIWKQTEGK